MCVEFNMLDLIMSLSIFFFGFIMGIVVGRTER